MRWKPEPYVNPKESWHTWFAWRPVWIGKEYVWLEKVERKLTYIAANEYTFVEVEYRNLKDIPCSNE